MKQILALKLCQQLTMTPQLQQAIKILQLSTPELELEIQNALSNNLMLEAIENIEEDLSAKIVWQNTSKNINNNDYLHNQDYTKNIKNEESLHDYLIWQLNLTPVSQLDYYIAITIIDAINENGYLECSLEEIQSQIKQHHIEPIGIEEILAVLHRIQQFDPLGVAARNLKECLNIQLNCKPNNDTTNTARTLINHYLEHLAKKQYNYLTKRLHISSEQLLQVINLIKSLDPKPGRAYNNTTLEYIIPDLIVNKQDDKWVVQLNPINLPKLNINSYYANMLKQLNKEDHDYSNYQSLQDQLSQAKWLVKSIENRNSTILRVGIAIMQQQHQFLEYGPASMQALILHDIAKQLELHESTISRATSKKYISTPQGTFELKYFFSSKLANHSGAICSATAIKALIKDAIKDEDRHKPLSDQQLVQLLQKNNISIARRTVTKYREAMTIPSSNQRKMLDSSYSSY